MGRQIRQLAPSLGPTYTFGMRPLTGERKALAAAVLGFYTFVFLIVALTPPPGWGPCFAALAGVYGLGFFSLVAGYFWARWYVIGVGMSGFISGLVSVVQLGPEPVLLFYGGTHLGASLVLWGDKMSLLFDGRSEWRDRFHMDENATNRLGKAVIRAGISLPFVVMYALAPREGAALGLTAAGAAALAGLGFWGLIRLRTWGLLALGGAAGVLLSAVSAGPELSASANGHVLDLAAVGLAAGILLLAAVVPFAGPVVRRLRSPDTD